MKMDRREFLRKAGMGSIALASLPTLVGTLATPARANGQTNFHCLATMTAGPAPTAASPQHRITMSGAGRFTPSQAASPVEGGGHYNHFLFPGANPPTGGTPLQVVASGAWKARLLVSYRQVGTWGVFAAGILVVVVDLFREVPSQSVIRGARLEITCNLGPAGLTTGQPEGIALSIPGTDFSAGGNPGPFVPVVAPGTTLFTTVPIP